MGNHPVPYRHASPQRRAHWIEPTRRDIEPARSPNLDYERGVQWGIATRHREITDREAHAWGPNPPAPAVHVHHTHRLVNPATSPAFYAAFVVVILVLTAALTASVVYDPDWIPPGKVLAFMLVAFPFMLAGIIGFFVTAKAQEHHRRHGHR